MITLRGNECGSHDAEFRFIVGITSIATCLWFPRHFHSPYRQSLLALYLTEKSTKHTWNPLFSLYLNGMLFTLCFCFLDFCSRKEFRFIATIIWKYWLFGVSFKQFNSLFEMIAVFFAAFTLVAVAYFTATWEIIAISLGFRSVTFNCIWQAIKAWVIPIKIPSFIWFCVMAFGWIHKRCWCFILYCFVF